MICNKILWLKYEAEALSFHMLVHVFFIDILVSWIQTFQKQIYFFLLQTNSSPWFPSFVNDIPTSKWPSLTVFVLVTASTALVTKC